MQCSQIRAIINWCRKTGARSFTTGDANGLATRERDADGDLKQ